MVESKREEWAECTNVKYILIVLPTSLVHGRGTWRPIIPTVAIGWPDLGTMTDGLWFGLGKAAIRVSL